MKELAQISGLLIMFVPHMIMVYGLLKFGNFNELHKSSLAQYSQKDIRIKIAFIASIVLVAFLSSIMLLGILEEVGNKLFLQVIASALPLLGTFIFFVVTFKSKYLKYNKLAKILLLVAMNAIKFSSYFWFKANITPLTVFILPLALIEFIFIIYVLKNENTHNNGLYELFFLLFYACWVGQIVMIL